nr:Chain S, LACTOTRANSFERRIN [Camelus dromedarius]2J4U_X Chain X, LACTOTRANSFERRIN [Camelus dromedarius]
ASKKSVRWCTTSPAESKKCAQWQRRMKKVRGPSVTCVKKTSRFEC